MVCAVYISFHSIKRFASVEYRKAKTLRYRLLPGFQNLLPIEPFNCQFNTLHLPSNLSLILKTLSPLIIFQAPSPVTLSTIAVSPIYYIWPKLPRHTPDDRKLRDNLWIPGAEEEAHNTQFPFQTITQQSQLRIDSTPNFLYRTPVQQRRSACCGRPRDVYLVLSCREWSQKARWVALWARFAEWEKVAETGIALALPPSMRVSWLLWERTTVL